MLNSRSSLRDDDDFVSNDMDTVKLLQQGGCGLLHILHFRGWDRRGEKTGMGYGGLNG